MPRVLSYIKYIVAVICMISGYVAIGQEWNPGHSVGTVTGKYTFSSVQVPDQLVELGSPTISVAVFTYLWESMYLTVENYTRIQLKSIPFQRGFNPSLCSNQRDLKCWTWKQIIRSYYFISRRD